MTGRYDTITNARTLHWLVTERGLETEPYWPRLGLIRMLEVDDRNRTRAGLPPFVAPVPSINTKYHAMSGSELHKLCQHRGTRVSSGRVFRKTPIKTPWMIQLLLQYDRQHTRTTPPGTLTRPQQTDSMRLCHLCPERMLPSTPLPHPQPEDITTWTFFPERSLPITTIRPQRLEIITPRFLDRRLRLISSPITPSPATHTLSVTPLRRQHPFA